ncbi:hypothetical protein J5Y09_11145 [Roseomonas sp. PWR1]|uniref:Uncharacterized protein n=1 Tax=Roseomonas nitratireducens TaxID=2820810 RepID=A0ABS4ASY5_9PROT|nr:hypothetical protein [Neoroseomonas nitratireducens]MBP0464461.1 hypothetical protein [Neoroseomonas nitratireducens]
MRAIHLLLALALLPGCQAIGAPGAPLLAIPAAVEAVSLRAFGRTTGDSLVSLVTGEDCSIARIGRGEAYCGRDDAPAPPPMCTRSLGAVDCWNVPPPAYPAYRGVADGPATLNEAQENNRIGWAGRIGRAVQAAAQPPAPAVPAAPVVEPAPPVQAASAVQAQPLPQPAELPAVANDAARRALAAPTSAARANDRAVPDFVRPAEGNDFGRDVRRLLEP